MIEEQVARNGRGCRLGTVGKGCWGVKQSHSEYKVVKEIFKMNGMGDIRFYKEVNLIVL